MCCPDWSSTRNAPRGSCRCSASAGSNQFLGRKYS
uniref:Uncharacterized protein n=1 Tax=Anopheles quadriannulatus TaxID=34691 RepID=A0A182XSY0_ANOQN